MSDPIAVFRAAAAALESGAWDDAAAMCDPASLLLYKRDILARLETPNQAWTAEDLRRNVPYLPPDVAEFQAAQLAEQVDPRRILKEEYPSISSVEEFRALPPAKVFAAWLEGQSFGRMLERAREIPELPAGALEAAMQFHVDVRYKVLGAVSDGDHLAFVVFRREYHSTDSSGSADDSEDDVLPDLPPDELSALRDQAAYAQLALLRRQGDGSWRLMAGREFLGLGHSAFSFGFDGGAQEQDGSALGT